LPSAELLHNQCINYLIAFPHTGDILISPEQLNFKFFTWKGNSVLNILLIHNAMHDLACMTATKNATAWLGFGIQFKMR